MIVAIRSSMNVIMLLLFLDLYYAQISPGLDIQANIRHSRSRARFLRGRRHDDDNSRQDNSSDEISVSELPIVVMTEVPPLRGHTNHKNRDMSGNLTVKHLGRKVTVGSGLGNSSWQHVDKSMLYVGERALNQINNKKNNKSASDKGKGANKELSPVESEGLDLNEKILVDSLEEVEISSEKSSFENVRSGQVDIVTRFLRIVESQHLLGENCSAGTDLNLGEGVVDRYAQERFRVEADVAVNRANMLTRLWKYAEPEVLLSEYLLHASVFSMVEFDNDIFAAGNCYDQYQYKDYWLFCPYAYRLSEGTVLVKDLAVEYKYHSNTSEWFYIARKNAEKVIRNYNQFSRGKCNYSQKVNSFFLMFVNNLSRRNYEIFDSSNTNGNAEEKIQF